MKIKSSKFCESNILICKDSYDTKSTRVTRQAATPIDYILTNTITENILNEYYQLFFYHSQITSCSYNTEEFLKKIDTSYELYDMKQVDDFD